MYSFLAFFLSIAFCCAPVFGEELALAELIDIALKNNPKTERNWASVKRAQASLEVAKSGNYPQLDAKGSLTHAREVKYPNGPNTVFTSYGAELNLNYLLFDFGETRATIQAAKEALHMAQWWADFEMQRVVSDVAASYYEYLNGVELLKTQEASLQDAQEILEAAEELHKAGLRSRVDFSAAKGTVAEMRMAVARQKAAAAFLYGKLLTAMGLAIETKLQVQTAPKGMENPLFAEGITTLIKMANEQRADLLAKQASLAEMNSLVDRATRAPRPKLRGTGQGGWYEYAKHQGSGYNYSGGIALEIPLFKGFEYSYQKRRAIADAEITAAELKELQNGIALEVLQYSEGVKAAQESMQYSEEFLSEASLSYDYSMESYKAGLINIFDLLQSKRLLAEARTKKAQARTEWLVSLAQLAFATGSLTK